MERFGRDDIDDNDDSRNIQPHLGSLQFKENASLDQINPAFEDTVDSNNSNCQSNKQYNEQNAHAKGDMKAGHLHGNTFPVVYSNTGQNGVVQEQVVIKKPDGTNVIKTEQCSSVTSPAYKKRQKPLTKDRILRLKILSIMALIVYFPLGIPAIYFAFQIQKQFDEGIVQGNIDKAQKYANRAEKLIIFSVIFAILTAVVIFSLVDRLNRTDDDDSGSLTNRVFPG